MPYINLKTNIDAKNSIESLKTRFGQTISIIPGKTERWLMVGVQDNIPMYFGGSGEPCAIAEVSLFGSASDEAYNKMTCALTEVISEETGIIPERIYIKYDEVSTWGYSGENF